MGRSTRRAATVAALLCITGLGVPAAASALTPGHILVSDYFGFDGNGGLIDVDPGTGARTTVSANDHPVGTPNFNLPVVAAFEADGDIVVPEQDGDDVLRIDPATGARTTVSSSSVGTGPALSDPNGIAVAANGDLFVADFSAFDGDGGIIRIDPVTGNRTEVSSNGHGSGPAFGFGPDGIAIAADGSLVVADTFGYQVLRVDPATGNRTTISSNSVGTGPTFDYLFGLALEPDGHILVCDEDGFDGNGGIIRIDPATGNRTTVSSNAVGSGPALNGPASLAVAPDGSIITGTVGADFTADGAVFRVDPVSGNRTLISSNASPPGAPLFTDIYGVAIVPTTVSAYPAAVAADGPVGYWRFGEPSGPTAHDETANHNDGTYVNGPVLGVPGALAGDTNTAARLDGVNDWVSVPNSASLAVGNTFTAEGWLKRTTPTKTVEMMNKGFQVTLMSAANGSQVWVRKPNVSTITRSATGVPVDTTYHHIAVTKNGSGAGAVKIYIDGSAVGTVDVSPAQVTGNSATPLLFGSSATSQADIDEFALYNHVLTATQIHNHYAAGHPGV
jgi:sugar lactone lactonase YvrE